MPVFLITLWHYCNFLSFFVKDRASLCSFRLVLNLKSCLSLPSVSIIGMCLHTWRLICLHTTEEAAYKFFSLIYGIILDMWMAINLPKSLFSTNQCNSKKKYQLLSLLIEDRKTRICECSGFLSIPLIKHWPKLAWSRKEFIWLTSYCPLMEAKART